MGRSRDDVSAGEATLGVDPVFADFAGLDEVRALALTWQVNHLTPFLLRSLLHERLSASGARVVVTSSLGHRSGSIDLTDLDRRRRRCPDLRVHCTTKLALILFAREVARHTATTGVTAVAFHPAVVGSGFGPQARGAFGVPHRTRWGRATTSPDQGAEALVHLASLSDPATVDGQYSHRLHAAARTSAQARDADLARALWQVSAQAVQ